MRLRSARTREAMLGYGLALPSIIVFLVIYLYPVAYSAYLSFFRWNMLGTPRPLGWTNYERLVQSGEFHTVLINTVNYSLGVVVLSMLLGLFLAHVLNGKGRLKSLLQACIFSSYIISWVAVSLLWIWILDPQYGIVTYILDLFGLPRIDWLGSLETAMLSIIVVTIWKSIGYSMVIFIAGMQGISRDYYEAATLDGANQWHLFRSITWPLLAPTTLFLSVTMLISSFQGFDVVRIMTQGGPIYATTIYVYYIYEQAFNYFRLGYASAAVVIFFIIILLITILQIVYFQRRIHYEGDR